MKLRTRLFLWVGIIFLFAFGVSLVFEERTTDKSLQKAEEGLRGQILALNEKRREHIENYLHIVLAEDQAQIDSLLLRIARDPRLGAVLFLEPKNLNLVAPVHSTFLFKNDRWIDFIQTTKDDKLTSLFVPIDFPMKTTHKIPIDDQISWIVLDDDEEIEHPYIGVKLTGGPEEVKSLSLLIDELIEIDWGLTILFQPEAIIKFERKAPVAQETVEGFNLAAFLDSVEHAAEYLKKLKGKNPSKDWVTEDIRSKEKENFFDDAPFDRGVRCLEEEGEVRNAHIVERLQRSDQAIMLSALASLFPTDAFGPTPFSPSSPKGIARFTRESMAGYSVFTNEVFFQKKMFDDAAYLKDHPSAKECEGIGSSVAVITPTNMERVFIANTLLLKGTSSEGYLTIGIDAEEFVEDLVLSENKSAFLVHDGRVINGFYADGKQIQNASAHVPFNKEMLTKKSGIIDWDGKSYYYLHMIPFKNLDLHFYLLQPEKEAFALVRSIEEGSRDVLKSVSWNMRLIAFAALIFVLLLLHRVAKRITKPITQLASVTKDVAQGKLEGLQLPSVPKGRHDEIASLCDSFSQMVTGLQEKEKVKDVLNKVVSPEIAQEITKGQVHLGGEERKVTVLFADIRGFTEMSFGKPPAEIIEMLNACMTKISHAIDEHGGVIDKYVGDEVMALFGAPIEKEDSALKAVQSALKIIETLKGWNQERVQKGLKPVEMGIGIHTGNVLIGNMGAENRLNYTVIGSNVNLAARLCDIAGRMEILVSKETLSEPHVGESIQVEEMPPTELKGYEEKFVLYRVKGGK